MRKFAGLLLCLIFGLSACAQLNEQAIPDPFKTEIVKLRDNNVELAKKCQDLQKEVANLQAQQNWNAQRMNLLGGEALTAAGVSQSEYVVNVDRLKIVPLKR